MKWWLPGLGGHVKTGPGWRWVGRLRRVLVVAGDVVERGGTVVVSTGDAGNRRLIARLITLAALVVLFLAAYGAAGLRGGGWYSVVPPVVAVATALATGRLFLSLIVAVVAGGLLSAAVWPWWRPSAVLGGLAEAVRFVVGTVYGYAPPTGFDVGNVLILLFVVFIMAMISVILAGGGLQGLANWLMRYARTARSTRLVTFATGLAIFIDDYANTMIVGATMRPVTDRQRISREKLAFLVDATAAPVAGLAFISTWIGYEVGLLSDVAGPLGIAKDGYAIFFDAFLFRFYCLGMIAFVFFNSASGVDFGPMARAERRAAREGKLLDDGAMPMTSRSFAAAEPHPSARVRARVALVPMLVVFVVFLAGLWCGSGLERLRSDPLALLGPSAWREALAGADSTVLLARASAAGLAVSIVLVLCVSRIPAMAVVRATLAGVRNSLLPVTVLILAWSLKRACDALHTGDYLAGTLGETLTPALLPALVFVVAAATSFATGTSYGTMAILIPTAVPVAFRLDGGAYGLVTVITIAAVLDGAIFGDHCSPISDTTIMSSVGSSCDHLAHVRTQLPYSLAVAAVALLAGYLPAVAGLPRWAGIPLVATIMGGIFLALASRRRAAEPPPLEYPLQHGPDASSGGESADPTATGPAGRVTTEGALRRDNGTDQRR